MQIWDCDWNEFLVSFVPLHLLFTDDQVLTEFPLESFTDSIQSLVKRELADSICVKHDTISFELIQRSVGEGKIDSVELGTCFQVSGFYCLNFLILFLFATLVTDAHLSFDNKKVYLGIVDKLSNITNSFVNLFYVNWYCKLRFR